MRLKPPNDLLPAVSAKARKDHCKYFRCNHSPVCEPIARILRVPEAVALACHRDVGRAEDNLTL
jgi:hypothetical protein